MLIIEYTPVDYAHPEAGYWCGSCDEYVWFELVEHQKEHGALGYRIRPKDEDIA